MIAAAIALNPALLIADEATTDSTSPCRRRYCGCCNDCSATTEPL
jgi:energy-coupling factor transporter ATP-binding protein EcfA2